MKNAISLKCIASLVAAVLLTGLCGPGHAQGKSDRQESSETKTVKGVEPNEFFKQRILPVLVSRCFECHSESAKELQGGLRLDSRSGMRNGGDSGPAVVPGNGSQSLLLTAITATDNAMPPDQPLSQEVIDDFRAWIAAGAFDPRQDQDDVPLREPDYTDARKYWAFQPVRHPDIPQVDDDEWCRSPIDNFILEKLATHGLQPARMTSPERLLRRVTFDLTGLPPTPEQVAAFVSDYGDQAYDRVVEELLNSPQYGEKQAQHWLDVIRYAETEGFEYDRLMPGIWRYRDYVISAFNSDMPYDQFLVEQLAGDELAGDIPADDAHRLRIAAGFHRLGAVRRNAGNQAVASSRNEVLIERTDIIGSAILGLTVGCARCHDHKFDPIPQQDYYRLQAFFAASQEENISLRDPAEQLRLETVSKQLEKEIAGLKESLDELEGEQADNVRAQIQQLTDQLPPPGPTICSITNDWENASPPRLLKRGNPDLPGPTVGMRSPGVLTVDSRQPIPFDTPQPRSILARELVDPAHPLTPRVIANRLWQQHFGTGLVSTANDFGHNGSAPSHPELLDYLAHRLVSGGWSLKALHRQIVTSSVYRQDSFRSSEARETDPRNRLLSHFPRRRLTGEEIRDAMLSISGQLNPEIGGESVVLPVEAELVDQLYKPSQWEVTRDSRQHARRSIYLLAKRNLRLPFMEVFDQPSSQTSCAAREQSTHARQALELLNGPIVNELSGALARRLQEEAGNDAAAVAHRAYQLVAGRAPSESELSISVQFLQDADTAEFALAMFNLNAFLYVD